MASFIYDKFTIKAGDNTIDMDGDTFHAVLLADTYTPSSTHGVYTDISSDELATGGGYTNGGQALAGVPWAETGGVTKFDAGDVSWAASTITARYMAIMSNTATLKDLVCLYDFTTNRTTSSTAFTVQFPDAGIITFTRV